MNSKTSKKATKCVLAIYPNAIGFGYAVMKNAYTEIDSQIVVSRPMNNTQSMKRIKKDIAYYEPDIVVLEDYNGKQSLKSKRVQKLIDLVRTYARSKNVKVLHYSREQIRFVFKQFDNAKTKYEISLVIAENIPSLERYLRPKRKLDQSEPYTMGIFDAVSLAITHYYITD